MQSKQNKAKTSRKYKFSLRQESDFANNFNKKSYPHLKPDELPCMPEQKNQTSAVMSLLLMKDQTYEDWKEKKHFSRLKQNLQKQRAKQQLNRSSPKIIQPSPKKKDQLQQKQLWQIQPEQIWEQNSPQKIFSKRGIYNQNQILQKQRNQRQKHKNDFLSQENLKLIKDHKHNTFFMNRTNYWSKHNNSQRTAQSSLRHKFKNSITFYKPYQKSSNNRGNMTSYDLRETQKYESVRVNSHLSFHKLSSGNLENQHCFQIEAENEKNQEKKSIKIVSNKAFTVRQMLQKINSKQDIYIVDTKKEKSQNSLSLSNRQPFDPYPKRFSRQHHKKFTPFKAQHQKSMEYSLRKLEQHLKSNPQIVNDCNQAQIHIFEKPTYCSWVQRNKEKLKKRKCNYPLTVRPLHLIN